MISRIVGGKKLKIHWKLGIRNWELSVSPRLCPRQSAFAVRVIRAPLNGVRVSPHQVCVSLRLLSALVRVKSASVRACCPRKSAFAVRVIRVEFAPVIQRGDLSNDWVVFFVSLYYGKVQLVLFPLSVLLLAVIELVELLSLTST